MTAFLSVDQASIEFGDVTLSTTATVTIRLTNTGDEGLQIDLPAELDYAIAQTPPLFAQDLALPQSLFESTSVEDPKFVDVIVSFHPILAGVFTGTLTYRHNAINNPLVIQLSGTGVASGSALLSVSPSSGYTFPDQLSSTPSDEKLFTLTNTGSVAFNVTALAFTAPFIAGATQPALPYALAAGASVDVGVVFSPGAGYQFYSEPSAFVITSTATGSPHSLLLQGLAFPFVVAFVASGSLVVLAGFRLGSVIDVLQFDPSDLNCEEECVAARLTNFSNPTYENTLFVVQVDYEDLGEASLVVEARSRRDPLVSDTLALGTVSADEDIRRQLANLQISEEVLELRLRRLADGGPVSCTGYTPSFEPGGDVRKNA